MERKKKLLKHKVNRSSRNHSQISSNIRYVVKTIKPHFVKVNKSYPIEAYSQTHQRLQVHDKQDKLRILFTLDQLNIGGTETHTLTIARELLKLGHHVVIAAKSGRMVDSFTALGCPIYNINFVNERFTKNEECEEEIIVQLKNIITTENIHVAHCHQTPSGEITVNVANQLKIPVLCTLHGTYYDKNFITKVLQRCSSVICVSPSVKKSIPKLHVPVLLIPNGIDTIEYDYLSPLLQSNLRKELEITEQSRIILYTGRLSWEKADICEKLIRASQTLREDYFPDLHLLIAGGGIQEEHIKLLADQAHINTNKGKVFIHILGETINMRSIYSISDCVIGTGRTALEAMACKRPVIAAGTKGYFGIIAKENYAQAWNYWFGDHGSNQSCSEELFINSIKQVLEMPEDMQIENGWLGRKFVQENFQISRSTVNLIEIYQKLIKNTMI